MLIKIAKSWALPERAATPEALFHDRRRLVKGLAAGSILAGSGGLLAPIPGAAAADPAELPADHPLAAIFPAPHNDAYTISRPLSDEQDVTTYNNFYEFGSHKNVWKAAQKLEVRPWEVVIDGLVDKEVRIQADELIKRMPNEERLYRHRCVEAWSFTVPWTGFPLKALVDMAQPLSGAKYLTMTGFMNPDVAPGQRQHWYPWPYVEGLTLAEATHDLSLIVTGAYGRPLPKQNGAPLRLAVPWKYGFKHIKSIQRFTFTDTRPVSFWEEINAKEYGFWANVNPEVPHPRWSQASEKVLGTNARVPTVLFNGYGEQVAHLYQDLQDEPLYR